MNAKEDLPLALLNQLNEMARMSDLSKQGHWDALLVLNEGWLEAFQQTLSSMPDLDEQQREEIVKSVFSQIDSIIERAEKDMGNLQKNKHKELKSLDAAAQYIKN